MQKLAAILLAAAAVYGAVWASFSDRAGAASLDLVKLPRLGPHCYLHGHTLIITLVALCPDFSHRL